MNNVKAELELLKEIAKSKGLEAETIMFYQLYRLMGDRRFFKLLKEYKGDNPKILETKKKIK